MSARDADPGEPEGVRLAVLEAVRARVDGWFPDRAGRLDLDVTALRVRPRSSVFLLRVREAEWQRRLLVKVRGGDVLAGPGRPARPSLVPQPGPPVDRALAEWRGLVAMAAAVGPDDPHVRAVTPVDHIPELSAVAMEYVDAPTLRRLLIEESRLPLARRTGRTPPVGTDPWRNAGAALRRYHSAPAEVAGLERNGDRDELLDAARAYGEHLARLLSRPDLRDLAEEVGGLLARALPRRLDLVVGHGDFAPRNVFALADGRVALFDPMPTWRCPPFEDLSRFTVGVRLLGLQVHAQGLALGRSAVDGVVRSFREGYAGAEGPDPRQVRAYELLVLLDKWSAMATATSGPRPLRDLRRRWTGRYADRVALRLLREARSA